MSKKIFKQNPVTALFLLILLVLFLLGYWDLKKDIAAIHDLSAPGLQDNILQAVFGK